MHRSRTIPAVPFPELTRRATTTLQVNLGYRCNQACSHCHVDAGPHRIEMMDQATLELVLAALRRQGIARLDLTGGAPELHEGFRSLVVAARAMEVEVIDRCNLTILSEPGQGGLAAFLAAERVTVVASLPCYEADNVDRQRGRGVFERSIDGIRQLNALGYGLEGSGLELHLVYNPQGPSLPPPQDDLGVAYKRELAARHGVVFNRLLALANMPIKRFATALRASGELESYHQLLEHHHRSENLASVMCRDLVSVDWQGYLYDCDFNQQLGLPLGSASSGHPRPHLRDLLYSDLEGASIPVARHCFGCTAGSGSSCGGALS